MKITKQQLKKIIKEALMKELTEDEEGAQPQDPAELLRQWTREKPLYGMTPEHSEKIFLHQFRARLLGEIKSTGEAKDAYDKLYRILDPRDYSHLPDY